MFLIFVVELVHSSGAQNLHWVPAPAAVFDKNDGEVEAKNIRGLIC